MIRGTHLRRTELKPILLTLPQLLSMTAKKDQIHPLMKLLPIWPPRDYSNRKHNFSRYCPDELSMYLPNIPLSFYSKIITEV